MGLWHLGLVGILNDPQTMPSCLNTVSDSAAPQSSVALRLFLCELNMQMLRSARPIIDIGLHLGGWGRDAAIQLLSKLTAMPTDAIATQIDRYIALPGQACCYKIGECWIRHIKRHFVAAYRAYCPQLDIMSVVKTYHSLIIDAGVPTVRSLLSRSERCLSDVRHRAAIPIPHDSHSLLESMLQLPFLLIESTIDRMIAEEAEFSITKQKLLNTYKDQQFATIGDLPDDLMTFVAMY